MKRHYKFNNSELWSDGYYNYFSYDNSLYSVKQEQLNKLLFEIELKRPSEQLQIILNKLQYFTKIN
jgi:hypothetical protein